MGANAGTPKKQRKTDKDGYSAYLLRLTPEQHDRLEALAQEKDMTLRALIVSSVLGDFPARPGRPRKHQEIQEALLPRSA